MNGRRLWAGLHLLDRQLVDRDGRLAGCVDDLELAYSEDTGNLYVSAIISGPGALARRLRRDRIGAWLGWVHSVVSVGEGDPARIPFNNVMDMSDHITVAMHAEDSGVGSAERWVREHVIDHIPGSGRAPE